MFDEIKESLKEKWLEYYKANSAWIKFAMTKNGNFQKGGRPSSMLILGVITSLEPDLISIMSCLCQLNSDPDLLIKALGLDFDPDEELEEDEESDENSENVDVSEN
jgi:hypothetical protein